MGEVARGAADDAPQSAQTGSMHPGQTIRAFLIGGGALAVNIALVVVRAKLVAVMLGPAGIGLLGLFTAVQEIAAQIADGGLSHSAVRQIATARDDPARIAALRRVLGFAVVALGAAGALVCWILRAEIARVVTGDPAHAFEFGLLGLGVWLTAVWRWRQALLSGYLRVGDLARTVVLATALATTAGLAAILVLGTDGLIWAALAVPAAGVLVAPLWTRRLPGIGGGRPSRPAMRREAGALFRLGLGLMAVALLALSTPLVIRAWLAGGAGLEAAGHYQAVWVIAMQLMTVMLAAAAIDFYPRLSVAITDREAATALVNGQSLIHLVFGGPAVLMIIAFAPWILQLLFAAPFAVAGDLLRWQMIACLPRLAAVPAETIPTALGRPLVMLPLHLAQQAIILALVWLWLPGFGLAAIGMAFCIGHAIHLVALSVLVRRLHGFRWQNRVGVQLGVLMLLGLGLIALDGLSPVAAMIGGALAALLCAAVGLRQLAAMLGPKDSLGCRICTAFARAGWPISHGPAGAVAEMPALSPAPRRQ